MLVREVHVVIRLVGTWRWFSLAILLALLAGGCASSGRRSVRSDAGTPSRDAATGVDAATGDDGGGGSDAGGSGDAGGAVDGGDDAGPDLCTGVDCSGLDGVCQTGVCDPADGSCGAVVDADGTACDDGSACTSGETCTAGACSGGTPVDCSALDTACAVGACNPSDASCAAMARADGTTCDDGNRCTTADRCTGGACGGTAVDCSAMSDMCNVGACNGATGACTATPVTDGTACNDMDACTTGYMCTGGTCAGTMTGCGGGYLVPGRTDLVATRDGWSVRCLAWSGRTCTRGQARMECSVCPTYTNCGLWHDVTTYNDGGNRCSQNFCALATGSAVVNSTSTGAATAVAPRACGWGSSTHPHCEAIRASYHVPVTGVGATYGLLLNESYCGTQTTLRTFDCGGW